MFGCPTFSDTKMDQPAFSFRDPDLSITKFPISLLLMVLATSSSNQKQKKSIQYDLIVIVVLVG
jgi:hypothetical protein